MSTAECIKEINFYVAGVPAPGGSKKAFVNPKTGRAIIVDDAKNNTSWRERVAAEASRVPGIRPLDGPLSLEITFFVLRPRSHIGKRGRRPSAPVWPAVRPDITKLVRALEDALKSICWHDDAQIVMQTAIKRYSDIAGARVRIKTVNGPDVWEAFDA